MKRKTIKTTWNVRTYDVWGNAKEGYDVNDSYNQGDIELDIPVTLFNANTLQTFESVYPTLRQIRSVFGIRCQIDLDGDDLTIYVNRRRDSYPIGELHCESHKSLSPIKVADDSEVT